MVHTLLVAGRQDDSSPMAIPPILSCGSTSSIGSGATSTLATETEKKKYSSVGSAKELPVWLIGTFLLLHCEESANERNLSGTEESGGVPGAVASGGDFANMFQQSSR